MSDDWGSFTNDNDQIHSKLSKPSMSSAIIDMNNIDNSSATSSFEDVGEQDLNKADTSEDINLLSGFSGNLGKVVADQMWQSGQRQAKHMLNVYANIDVLRPYFDIECRTLMIRVATSFVPARNLSKPQKIPSELYGPLMTVFTLIAILLLNMKNAGTVLQQGTLMGTAFGICFGYWFGVSGFIYFLAYLCNTYISVVQCLSLLGYGMVSHCVILLVGHFTHYSHGFFYLLWAIIAGSAAARMVTVLLSRTVGKSQRLMLCFSIAAFHMLFLLYLHFAYHKVFDEIIEVLEAKEPNNLVPDSNPIDIDEANHVIPV